MKRLLKALLAIEDRTLLVGASLGTLLALALMLWQFFDPTVWPIMVAMSIAQGIGTLSFAIYGFVVGRDLVRKWRARGESGHADS